MNCPQCSNEMVKARATARGDEYDYCRTCRKELSEMQPKSRLICTHGCRPIDGAVAYYCPIHGNAHKLPPPSDTQSANDPGPCYAGVHGTSHHRFAEKHPTPAAVCTCGQRNWSPPPAGILPPAETLLTMHHEFGTTEGRRMRSTTPNIQQLPAPTDDKSLASWIEDTRRIMELCGAGQGFKHLFPRVLDYPEKLMPTTNYLIQAQAAEDFSLKALARVAWPTPIGFMNYGALEERIIIGLDYETLGLVAELDDEDPWKA